MTNEIDFVWINEGEEVGAKVGAQLDAIYSRTGRVPDGWDRVKRADLRMDENVNRSVLLP